LEKRSYEWYFPDTKGALAEKTNGAGMVTVTGGWIGAEKTMEDLGEKM
jgi:hypothetical protein